MSKKELTPEERAEKKKKESRYQAVGLILLIALVWLWASDETGSESERISTGAIAPAGAGTTPQFINETCEEMVAIFGLKSRLSDLQKDELWRKYKGKAFKWPMWVHEVSSGLLGGYLVHYKCEHSEAFVSDVLVSYPDGNRQRVMQLNKGSLYEVQGVLKRYGELMGLSADAL